MPLFSPMMARTAQAAGLAFGIAGLVTLLASVVLQDLAFGWSTTLETSADAWHRIVSWVAAPWSGWLPVATPSLELVTDTRFPAGRRQARKRLRPLGGLVALCRHGVADLDHRATAAVADSGHTGPPPQEPPGIATPPGLPGAALAYGNPRRGDWQRYPGHRSTAGGCRHRHGTGTPNAAGGLLGRSITGGHPVRVVHGALRAGGSQSLQADRDTLAELRDRQEPGDRELLVVTRGWEPPPPSWRISSRRLECSSRISP